MKILITGATGLIGTEVTKKLAAAGHKVTATDRNLGEIPHNVKFIQGDLNDDAFIQSLKFNFDALIHLAVSVNRYDDLGFKTFNENVDWSYKLFAKAAAGGTKIVVYGSSMAIYGIPYSKFWVSPKFVPFDESLPLNQYEGYSLSKEVIERTADMWSNRSNTEFVGLRLPFCNTERVITGHATQLMNGDLILGRILAKCFWGYLDIRDAAGGILTLLDKKSNSKGSTTYNFAAPDTIAPYPTKEMLANFFPRTKVIREIPGYGALSDCSRWLDTYGYHPMFLLDRTKVGV